MTFQIIAVNETREGKRMIIFRWCVYFIWEENWENLTSVGYFVICIILFLIEIRFFLHMNISTTVSLPCTPPGCSHFSLSLIHSPFPCSLFSFKKQESFKRHQPKIQKKVTIKQVKVLISTLGKQPNWRKRVPSVGKRVRDVPAPPVGHPIRPLSWEP